MTIKFYCTKEAQIILLDDIETMFLKYEKMLLINYKNKYLSSIYE